MAWLIRAKNKPKHRWIIVISKTNITKCLVAFMLYAHILHNKIGNIVHTQIYTPLCLS